MIDDIREEMWQAKYALAKKYYLKFGNLDIKESFYTKDGITYDADGVALGRWLLTQKEKYRRNILSEEKTSLLREIGFEFTMPTPKRSMSWSEIYALAANYYNYYGDLEVDTPFRTKDGIHQDNDGIGLGYWVNNQRTTYNLGKMLPQREKLLREIGMRFALKSPALTSENILSHFRAYYDEYGDLDIDQSYRAKDGCRIGTWLKRVRRDYSAGILSQEFIDSLEELGIIWNIYTNQRKIRKICNEYNIYLKELTKNMSFQELFSKIAYLDASGLPIYVNNHLHELINMDNNRLLSLYNIKLEELIRTYYHKDNHVKVLSRQK